METTVTRPFFLEVLRLYNENKLTLEQVAEIFLITENYLFRRTICELPTNALNKIFLMLHREIVRYDGTEANYVEKFKYALLSKKEKSRFPDDAEFSTAFARKPVYLMNSKNKVYILERLENFGTVEDKDVYRHCDEGTYSIEHIMPQHLTPAWQKELGEDFEQIHEEWLHRAANLTLTAYNSKYGNSTFTEKKTMQNGFDDSGIRMNTWIAKKKKWTLAELEERSNYLMGRALAIWQLPATDFLPKEKQMDSYTLEDEAELTGRLIARFTFKNTEQPVSSWVEFFLRDESELTTDEPGSRHELRRRYWTYALPLIKEAHGEDGSFTNVSPSRENWINGFFGISGFSICCVANYDAARVEIVFQKGDKAENKKAFDELILHRGEIERAMGVSLTWNRAEDKKASKLYMQLSNVSIENEVDWLQMARFHAEWSKKFYDVIVPYIAGV